MPCNEHLPHRTWVGNKPWQSHDTATHRHNSKAWAARWCRKHVGADGRLDKTSKEDASDVYFGPSWEIRNTVRYRAPRYNAFRCLHPFCCQRSSLSQINGAAVKRHLTHLQTVLILCWP